MKTTGKKIQKGSGQIIPKGRSPEMAGASVTDRFLDIFLEATDLFKSGTFDKSLLGKVRELHRIIDADAGRLRDRSMIQYLKAKAFFYEVYDCFGCIDESKQLVQEGGEIFKRLPDVVESATPLEERELLREQIRFCLSWANAEYYRTHQYDKAQEVVSRIHRLVLHGLMNDTFPCFGTVGQISYYLGRIYRQMGRLDDAEENFAKAIEYYHRRAEQKKRQFAGDPRRIRLEVDFALHRSAICLGLGIGWVNYTRGHLSTALHNNIIPARIVFLNTNDELNQASLNVILGAIKRSAKNRKEIRSSIELIQKAYDVFASYGHRRYLAWAANGLSLAHFYGQDFATAREKQSEMMKLAEELDDFGWQSTSLTLRSRINSKLNDNRAAEEDASQAYDLADEHGQVVCKIDALIWRSWARLQLGRHADARADVSEALELNRQQRAARRTAETANPRIEALCHLNLAYSYALEHEGRKARAHFKQWEEMSREVEDGRVHDLATDVARAIGKLSSDFIVEKIALDDPKLPRRKIDTDNHDLQRRLNYKTHLRHLQKFLVGEARELSEEKQDIAKLLGISRQTLFQWENEWKSENKKSEGET
jgi:tetratricopeptide (TPR) repeat protein